MSLSYVRRCSGEDVMEREQRMGKYQTALMVDLAGITPPAFGVRVGG